MRDATAPFVPVYPQSDKHQVSTWTLRRAALDPLRRLPALDDPVPDSIRSARALPGRLEALRAVHVPADASDATTGRERLAYDELLRMQLAMGVQRNAAPSSSATRKSQKPARSSDYAPSSFRKRTRGKRWWTLQCRTSATRLDGPSSC